jgi:hypothetical protein
MIIAHATNFLHDEEQKPRNKKKKKTEMFMEAKMTNQITMNNIPEALFPSWPCSKLSAYLGYESSLGQYNHAPKAASQAKRR